jgi:hypothetical protein
MWPGSTPTFRLVPDRSIQPISASTCTFTTDGKCFTSPGWPSNYGGNGVESCDILVGTDVSLVVQSFEVTRPYARLTVDGYEYSGSFDGLSGQVVRAGDVIYWRSDGTVTSAGGFKICSVGT